MSNKKIEPSPLEAAAAGAKRLRALAGEHALALQDPPRFVAEHFTNERMSKLANMSADACAVLVGQRLCTKEEADAAKVIRDGRGK